jgi:hypothetical protein
MVRVMVPSAFGTSVIVDDFGGPCSSVILVSLLSTDDKVLAVRLGDDEKVNRHKIELSCCRIVIYVLVCEDL